MTIAWLRARRVRLSSALMCALLTLLVGVLLSQVATLSFRNDRVTDAFHELYYAQEGEHTWKSTRWLGILALQNPNDVWIHQEIIAEQNPDYIVEAGTFEGGSAVLWAMVLKEVNPQGKVITIDIENRSGTARALPISEERIEWVIGSSTDPEVFGRIQRQVAGKTVLVILDSDHSRAHVLRELELYSQLIPVGGYLIVQDTNVNGHPVLPGHGPGPMEALEEFLSRNQSFVSDRSREKLLFTMHPKGYLKRVR